MSNESHWRKSSFSGTNGDCVEVADLGDSIGIRDSKDPDAGHLTITRGQLAEVLDAVRDGAIDDLG